MTVSGIFIVRTVKQLDLVLEKIESLGIVVILTLMIVLSFGQVILRNFFQEGILWADLFLRQMVLWVGFLGASVAVRDGKHIAIDFLPNILPGKCRPILQTIANVAAGAISAVLAFAAWNFVQFERQGDSVLFLDIPVWVFQTILPYSFAVIAARFFLRAFLFSSGKND